MELLTFFALIWLVLGAALAAVYVHWLDSLRAGLRIKAAGTGLLIAALIYVGFAAYLGDWEWMLVELSGLALYGSCCVLALRFSVLWLAAGWGLHPLWDIYLHWLGPGAHIVPAWYAIACLAFDLIVAGYLLHIYFRETGKQTV